MSSTIIATYHGTCVECDESIVPGQRIRLADQDEWGRAWEHADCGSRPVTAPCVCSSCMLVHAGECF